MELLEFINSYWTIIAGIISVVGVFFYMQFKQSDFDIRMKEQKEVHDEKFSDVNARISVNEVKIESLKDKLQETISIIQQDLREIKTILKRDN